MKTISFIMWTICILLATNYLSVADKGESPYFNIVSGGSGVESLPLLSTTANVDISGVIADLTIIQVYRNTGNSPIEAIYTFPASSRAAVYYMKMTIKDRVIISQIREKKEAQQIYTQAKNEGKSASLLTESRPNVFTMNVANIMPNDTITIEFRYAEILEPKEGIYEFVYPAVVGPRYKGNLEKSEPIPDIVYNTDSRKKLYNFDINIKINSGVPLSFFYSETHKINIKNINEIEKEIKLEYDAKNGNRDFVLKYKIRSDIIQTGMIMTENGDENFFLLMLQPPKRVNNAEILPKEYIFLVDISGSQQGFPLDISKKLMTQVLNKLNKSDIFNIIVFSNSFRSIFRESQPATYDNIESAKEYIRKLNVEGGTEILQALKFAMNTKPQDGYSKIIAVLTDGYVENEVETFDYVSENLNKVNIFGFGIGKSVNRFYIDGLAKVGMGESFFALDQSSGDSLITEFIKYTNSPIMKDITIDYGDFWASETFPEKIPDLFAERPIIVIGKWKKPIKGTIKVSGTTPNEKLKTLIPLDKFGSLYSGDGLKYLWARKKVELYSDLATFAKKDSYKEELTDLGLKYSLLTEYTSFVAVDSNIRNQTGEVITVDQQVPVPEGVDNSVIYNIGSTVTDIRVDGMSVGNAYTGGTGMENPLIPSYQAPPIYIGPVFGMEFYSLENKFDYTNKSLLPNNLSDIGGHSYHFGLSYLDFLDRDFAWSFATSITYNTHSLSSSDNIVNPALNNRVLNYNGNVSDSLTTSLKYNNETSYSYLGVDLALNYYFDYNLSFNFDLGFHFLTGNKIMENLELTDTQSQLTFKAIENTQLENAQRKLILINADIPNTNAFQMPIGAGINFEMYLGAWILRFNYSIGTNLLNFQQDISNSALIHRIRLSCYYALMF
jgi:Ca-activated chloride channel family protein